MNGCLLPESSQEFIRKTNSQFDGTIGLSVGCKRRYTKSSRRDKIEYIFAMYIVGSA